jgi:hypothetical protein
MAEVKLLTARLAITSSPELGAKPEAQTLAVHLNQPVDAYKASLIKAEKETLPELFAKVREVHERLATWMKAQLIPLEAQTEALKPLQDSIKSRIFNVELYAGLVEKVEQVREGEPAPLTEKIRLFQRRAYMDEECLARYETGGMEFKDIYAFDAWLSKPDNFNRLLPAPRCVVAFRVRRYSKEFPAFASLATYIQLMDEERYNKKTYLYLRNGEQLFRLSTQIEFNEKLFPDMSENLLGQKLWAKIDTHRPRVLSLISDNEYQAIKAEEDRIEAERQAKEDAADEDDKWKYSRHRFDFDTFHPFEPSSVYHDDIAKYIRDEMEEQAVSIARRFFTHTPHGPFGITSVSNRRWSLFTMTLVRLPRVKRRILRRTGRS